MAVAGVLALPAPISAGMMIIAAAPIAALSNFYALLARADVALAVTLTAISSVAATVTMPAIVVLGFRLLHLDAAGFHLPYGKLLAQTVMGLLLPILIGMTIRRRAHRWAQRWRLPLQRCALAALGCIIAFVLADQWRLVRSQWVVVASGALAYTLACLGIGLVVAHFAARDPDTRRALLFGFPARNVTIATLIAVAMQGRTDAASFGAVFFLVQAALIVPLARVLALRAAVIKP
jgi:BASS family bile acid:Na+ symporter